MAPEREHEQQVQQHVGATDRDRKVEDGKRERRGLDVLIKVLKGFERAIRAGSD